MTDDNERGRESSDPPPPRPSEANSVDLSLSRAEHAVGKARAALTSAHGAEELAEDAAEVAQEALDVAKDIKEKLGNSPEPMLGIPGRGLFGAFAAISAEVHGIGAKLDTLVSGLATDRAAAEKKAEADKQAAEKIAAARRGSVARLVGWVASPSIALAIAALVGYLAGFHR